MSDFEGTCEVIGILKEGYVESIILDPRAITRVDTMWQCENEDYQVQADVFKHEHSCRRKQDGENNEHLKIMKNIYMCEIVGVHGSFWFVNWKVFWIKSEGLQTTFLKAGKPNMRNTWIFNIDDFKQTQVGSRRYLDGMDGISPIVGRLSMLLFLFFAPLLQEPS